MRDIIDIFVEYQLVVFPVSQSYGTFKIRIVSNRIFLVNTGLISF